jgi:thiamine-phosphate pyrophosphorylase
VSNRIDPADLRLIDANANRAREGIRTAEDYIRFKSGNTRWAQRLKASRHAISDLLGQAFKSEILTAARNVSTDPLKPEASEGNCTAQEENAKTVAHRGLKRAQEALRVLEEYLRGAYPKISIALSINRYGLYEAEQWLLNASDAAATLEAAKVYVLLSASLCKTGLLHTAEAALKGGARILQLREKEGTARAILKQARDLQSLCETYGAVLICNDRLDLATAAGTGGVHLGQDDLTPAEARKLCGEKLLIGRSTHSPEQAQKAVIVEQVDYIAIGSMYETSTKAGRILAGLKLAEQVAALNLSLPVFAIGGINGEKIKELKAAGVRRIAVSTAVIAQADPEGATRRLIDAIS